MKSYFSIFLPNHSRSQRGISVHTSQIKKHSLLFRTSFQSGILPLLGGVRGGILMKIPLLTSPIRGGMAPSMTRSVDSERSSSKPRIWELFVSSEVISLLAWSPLHIRASENSSRPRRCGKSVSESHEGLQQRISHRSKQISSSSMRVGSAGVRKTGSEMRIS